MIDEALIAIYIVILWCIAITVSTLKFIKWYSRKMRCTKELKATAIDIVEKQPGQITRGSVSVYKPILKTSDNIIITKSKYSQFMKLSIGQEIELLVNQTNYDDFIYKDRDLNIGIQLDIIYCIIITLIALEESIRCICMLIK